MRKDIIFNYIGNAWYTVMGFIFVPLYIKYLGTESYGLIGVFAVIQGWLSLLDLGMASTISREMATFKGGIHTTTSIRNLMYSIEVIYLIIAIGMVIGLILTAPLMVTKWLNVEKLPYNIVIQSLSVTGFVIAFRWMGGLYQSALSGLSEFLSLNIIKIIFSTLKGLGVIGILIWISPTIQAYFIYQGIIAGLETLTSKIVLKRYLPKSSIKNQFSLEALKKIWRFAAGITMITLLSMALTQIDKVFLAKWLTLTNFGFYSLASVVAGGLYMIVGPVSFTTGPHLIRLVAKGNNFSVKEAYHKYAQLISNTVIPVALVITFFGDHLISIWIKKPEITSSVAPIASILILGNMLNALMFIPYQLQIAHGWTKFATYQNAISVILLLPLMYLAARNFGGIGAACCWVLLNVGYLLVGLPVMHKYLLKGELINYYFKDVIPVLISVLFTMLLLKMILPHVSTNHIQSIGVLVIASTMALLSSALSTKLGRSFLYNSAQGFLERIKPIL